MISKEAIIRLIRNEIIKLANSKSERENLYDIIIDICYRDPELCGAIYLIVRDLYLIYDKVLEYGEEKHS